jgi:hypothetical protein
VNADTGRRCPGCRRSIAPHMYACGLCWRKLPKTLRDNISATWAARRYSPGSSERFAHEVAKAEADRWLADHYGRIS